MLPSMPIKKKKSKKEKEAMLQGKEIGYTSHGHGKRVVFSWSHSLESILFSLMNSLYYM